jgi:hypothetical protein
LSTITDTPDDDLGFEVLRKIVGEANKEHAHELRSSLPLRHKELATAKTAGYRAVDVHDVGPGVERVKVVMELVTAMLMGAWPVGTDHVPRTSHARAVGKPENSRGVFDVHTGRVEGKPDLMFLACNAVLVLGRERMEDRTWLAFVVQLYQSRASTESPTLAKGRIRLILHVFGDVKVRPLVLLAHRRTDGGQEGEEDKREGKEAHDFPRRRVNSKSILC